MGDFLSGFANTLGGQLDQIGAQMRKDAITPSTSSIVDGKRIIRNSKGAVISSFDASPLEIAEQESKMAEYSDKLSTSTENVNRKAAAKRRYDANVEGFNEKGIYDSTSLMDYESSLLGNTSALELEKGKSGIELDEYKVKSGIDLQEGLTLDNARTANDRGLASHQSALDREEFGLGMGGSRSEGGTAGGATAPGATSPRPAGATPMAGRNKEAAAKLSAANKFRNGLKGDSRKSFDTQVSKFKTALKNKHPKFTERQLEEAAVMAAHSQS